MSKQLHVIILAAGQGTRMNSVLPKVLHILGHKPLLEHVVDTAHELKAASVNVVYGHGGELVKERLSHQPKINWVRQEKQLGTGHAVMQAMPAIPDDETVLVLYGDVPLVKKTTLEQLITASESGLSILTAHLDNPSGYGRIIRNNTNDILEIVEEKDATDKQRKVKEINTGMLAVNSTLLKGWLGRLTNENVQHEYYLTDIIGLAAADHVEINSTQPETLIEIEGVNDKIQLAEVERAYQMHQAEILMRKGVTFKDPSRFELRGSLEAGVDVIIDVNVIIEGDVKLGNNVHVGANNVISNSTLGDNVTLRPNCVIEDSVIEDACELGPFARLRPQSHLASKAKIGNFVEIKKSNIGVGSKVNHLSYIGDTQMGSGVNVGAGTITCNYDGANKHQTTIGDNAFIGSNTQLVAPVSVGEGATIGAGSVISHDAPAGELTLSRAPQQTRKGWKRPTKK